MKVAIDTNALYTTRAGVARYVRGLLQGFRELAPPGLELVETAWPVKNLAYRQPARALRTFYRELVWTRWAAPRELAAKHVDLLHVTGSLRFHVSSGIRTLLFLHDLAVLRQPGRFRRWQRHACVSLLNQISRFDRVLCPSRFTADEAVQLLGLSPSKLAVVPHGCPSFPTENAAAKPADWPQEYFLFVGSLEPGKNIGLLRDAYLLAEKKAIALPPLLIVGSRWQGVAGEGTPPKGWRYLGHISDDLLRVAYRSATALLFPSQYEGFGFPILEAMTSNCPVICSRVASLPEVAGDAALYAPQTPDGYLDAMTKILSSPLLRDELVVQGKSQAGKFTWLACADRTCQVYREVLSRG